MATTGLAIGGSALLGPVGGAIGSIVGAYIDQKLIMPALFPEEDIQGQKLDNVRIQYAVAGSPINRAAGPYCKMAGTVIWCTDLIEVRREEEQSSGCGGNDAIIVSYDYYMSLAIAICEGNIQNIRQMIANSTIIYQQSDQLLASGDNVGVDFEYYETHSSDGHSSSTSYNYDRIIESNNSAVDLTIFQEGAPLYASGFSNATNNGLVLYQVYETFKSGSYSYVKGLAAGVATNQGITEAAGATVITLTQDLPQISARHVDSMTIYDGSQTTADPILEAYEGAGNVPAFKGIAYVVIENLKLSEFGNYPPQFSFLVERDTSITIPDLIERVCEDAGLSASEIDTSELSADTIDGLVIPGVHQSTEFLNSINLGYNVMPRMENGVLEFTDRSNPDQVVIDADDLGAGSPGEKKSMPAEFTDQDINTLPTQYDVEYTGRANDYSTSSRSANRILSNRKHTESISLPFVIDYKEAERIARTQLAMTWENARSCSLQLPPNYLYLQVNDQISITYNSENILLRIMNITIGHNFLLDIQAVREDTTAFDWTIATDGTSIDENGTLYIPPTLETFYLDFAPLNDDHINRVGFYVATCATDIDFSPWSGANLYRSFDSGTTFNFIKEMEVESTIGSTDTVLGDGKADKWDITNTVDITLNNGILSNKTAQQVVEGSNWCIIGAECIGFQTAVLIGTNQYRLSNLLRGLRDTDLETAGHATNERFVLLSANTIKFVDLTLSDIEVDQNLYPTPAGIGSDEVVPEVFACYGNTIKPFAPTAVTGSRDTSNNLTINWIRRTRRIISALSTIDTPLEEPTESYVIEIYDGSTVVRSIGISNATTTTYSAANQTADGLTPGDQVKMRIYQISATIGRGHYREATV